MDPSFPRNFTSVVCVRCRL